VFAVRLGDKTLHLALFFPPQPVGGVAGGEHDAHAGVDLPQPAQRLAAGEARHARVEDDQVHAAGLALEHLDRLLPVGGQEHLEAVARQERFAQVAEQVVVVGQQHARAAAVCRGRGRRDGGDLRRPVEPRQEASKQAPKPGSLWHSTHPWCCWMMP
jgi:hypothetical protein